MTHQDVLVTAKGHSNHVYNTNIVNIEGFCVITDPF